MIMIRGKLITRQLPYRRAAIIKGRTGHGEQCDGCERRIEWPQLAMEIPRADGTVAVLHADCFRLWDDIRRAWAA